MRHKSPPLSYLSGFVCAQADVPLLITCPATFHSTDILWVRLPCFLHYKSTSGDTSASLQERLSLCLPHKAFAIHLKLSVRLATCQSSCNFFWFVRWIGCLGDWLRGLEASGDHGLLCTQLSRSTIQQPASAENQTLSLGSIGAPTHTISAVQIYFRNLQRVYCLIRYR